MGLKFPKIKGLTIVFLISLMMLAEFPASAGQRHGRGRGHGRGSVVVVHPRGRGRNWTPRTPRRRFVRAVARRNRRNNVYHITPRRRRVRRGHIMH